MFKEVRPGVVLNLDYVSAIKINKNRLSFLDEEGRILAVSNFETEKEARAFLDDLLGNKKKEVKNEN